MLLLLAIVVPGMRSRGHSCRDDWLNCGVTDYRSTPAYCEWGRCSCSYVALEGGCIISRSRVCNVCSQEYEGLRHLQSAGETTSKPEKKKIQNGKIKL